MYHSRSRGVCLISCHTHASCCSALPQQRVGTWRETGQSRHSTKHSPYGIFHKATGSAQGSTSMPSLHTAQLRNDLCQVTLRKRGGESKKPGLLKLWNRYKCCILVWDAAGLGYFFPAQVISFSIRKKKVGAATSRKYKQETHLKLREGDSNLT